MNKKKSSWVGLFKYTRSIPLFAFLLLSANVWSSKLEQNQDQYVPERSDSLAQNDVNQDKNSKNVAKDDDQNKTFYMVEQMPVFPGGEEALLKFIRDNLKYPASAAEKALEGRTTIRFIISKSGEVTDVNVIVGFDPECDAEAARVIKLLPKWIPGKEKGKEVAVYFTIPISYKLTKKDKAIVEVKKDTPEPLVIIDGQEKSAEVYKATIIDGKKIKSMNLLKGKDATDKYGEKGKNGVLIINTK